MSSTTTENDQVLQRAIQLLHSTQPGSATELRLMLDEMIKQRYGNEKKTISNTISKRFLDEENNFPGMVTTPSPPPAVEPPQQIQAQESDEVINLTNSPETIADDDDDMTGIAGATESVSVGGAAIGTGSSAEEDTNLKEFNDLNCCICNEMVFTATNRLIECSKCNMLYHQECHKPKITDEEASEDQGFSWQCDNCCSKPSTTREAGIVLVEEQPIQLVAKARSSAASSRSSSSSNSSSPFYKQQENVASGGGATNVVANTTTAQQQQQPTPQQQSSGSSASSSSKHHHHHHHHHKSSSSSSHSSSSKSSSKHQDSSSSSSSSSSKRKSKQ